MTCSCCGEIARVQNISAFIYVVVDGLEGSFGLEFTTLKSILWRA